MEAAPRDAEKQAEDERYVRAYGELPQTDEELRWADIAVLDCAAELPWEEMD